jgi:hypothetical protein
MVQNKVGGINRVVTIYVDVSTVSVVRFSNVGGVVGKPWRDLLVGLGDERRVAVSCLTTQELVLVGGKVDT